jgi:phosphohistidine phosphatase
VGSIYLLRHAKSSRDDPKLADHDRPLDPQGLRNALTLAKHLGEEPIAPDLVLCSTSLRTRATLAAILDALDGEFQAAFEDDLYGASAAALLARLQAIPDSVRSMMLVGHNPGIEDLAILLGGDEAPDRLRTCALVTLSTDKSWPALAERTCTVESVLVPR